MALTTGTSTDSSWWVFALPAFLGTDSVHGDTFVSLGLLSWALHPGGSAWCHSRACHGPVLIPGSRGFSVFRSLFTLVGPSVGLTGHIQFNMSFISFFLI